MSKIYLELLDKGRKEIFQKLSHFKNIGYLAGGTALALQINHRKSYDFDVFIGRPITHVFKKRVEEVFGRNEYYVNTGDQISFHTEKNIGITFVHYYYSPIHPLVETTSISLAHLIDIAADKAHTIGRRAIWRDYVDFYFLLKMELITLGNVIQFAKKKFDIEFVETQFLEQLVYFKDLTVAKIEYIADSPSTSAIQSFLEKRVEEYLAKVLKV